MRFVLIVTIICSHVCFTTAKSEGLHSTANAVAEFLQSTLKNETNARLLEQYASHYMDKRPISMQDEFTEVTSILGRNLLMLSSTVDTFNWAYVNDSFFGYAYTSLLDHFFSDTAGLSITTCSDNAEVIDVIWRNLPPSHWVFNKAVVSTSIANSSSGDLCNRGLSSDSRYHFIVHVCSSTNCFFELPFIQNCSSSSLTEFVSVRTSSSLPNGSCISGHPVESYAPCMISRYICLDEDIRLVPSNQKVRNVFAAAIFNTSAFQQWAEMFSQKEEEPKFFTLRKISQDCTANPNAMVMSLTFVNHICCSNTPIDDSRRFAAVGTFICRKGSPKQIIDTHAIGLLLKYRLSFSSSTFACLIDTMTRNVVLNPFLPFVQSISFDNLYRRGFSDPLLADIIKHYMGDFLSLTVENNDKHFVYKRISPPSPHHNMSTTIFDVFVHKFLLTSNWVLVFIANRSEVFQRLVPRTQNPPKEDHYVPAIRFHRAFNVDIQASQTYPRESPCYLFRYNSSFDSAAVFFSNIAFEDPSKQEATFPLTDGDVEGAVVPSRSLLRDYIPSHVQLLSRLSHAWQIHAAFSSLKPYIVRRLAATSGGVHMMFPGSFEPHSEWRATVFHAAFRYPGTVIATRPFLDPTGFGHIVMFSVALSPFLAVAVDVTHGFAVTKILKSVLPAFSGSDFYILNTEGYVIASLLNSSRQTSNSYGPSERFHASQQEPNVFADMLQRGIYTKHTCAHFISSTSHSSHVNSLVARRFLVRFSVNSSLISASSIVQSRACIAYNVSRLSPKSDLFIVRLNRSCTLHTAICPCSIVGRTCLTCAGTYLPLFSLTSCECPCECAHLAKGATDTLSVVDACPSEMEYPAKPMLSHLDLQHHIPIKLAPKAAACPLPMCDSYSLPNCSGSIGCELCLSDQNGKLAKPYCSTIKTCFGGVVGGLAPYLEWKSGSLNVDEHLDSALVPVMSPFGLVASCLVLSLILAAVIVYAFLRSRNMSFVASIRSTISASHLDPAATNRLLNNLDPDGCDNNNSTNNTWGDSGDGLYGVASTSASGVAEQRQQPQQALLLAVFDQPAVQNTMLPSIRRHRPPQSDVGYSSSMPNEDSATEDSSAASISGATYGTNNVLRWNVTSLVRPTPETSAFPTIMSSDIFSSTPHQTPPLSTRPNLRSHNVIDCL